MRQGDKRAPGKLGAEPASRSISKTPKNSDGRHEIGIGALEFDAPTRASGRSSDAETRTSLGSRLVPQSQQTGTPWWYSQFYLMIAAFGLLALAAILFVILVPTPTVDENAIRQASQNNAESATAKSDAPWTQSQQAEARSDSQSILQNLLTSKKELQNKGVLEWAPERYQQALDLATQGDELYTQQDFKSAIAAYQLSADEMDSLYELLPKLIITQLAEGQAAIREGKAALAERIFTAVMKLDSGNLSASLGLDRARKLDQVLQLITAAKVEEADFLISGNIQDLLSARQKLQDAKLIDEYYKPVDQGLQRVQLSIVDKRFKVAMTDAYQALFKNQYGPARKAFAKALRIKPGDGFAASALQQSLAADKTTTLKGLLANARVFEKNEEWASAKSNYQTVLQRDPSQVNAKMGMIRAGARQQLDEQIRQILADTLAFSRDEANSQATKLLVDAKAIKTKGVLLSEQITQLENALAQAGKSVKVSLLSDNFTAVSLQKIGSKPIKFGSFVKKNIALKPGRYVATGVRLGYRDVRTEIELYVKGEVIQSFTIMCNEPLKISVSLSSD